MPPKQGMSCARTANIGCGSLTALFGAMMIGGGLLDFGEKGAIAGDLAMLVLFGMLPFAIGAFWIARTLRAQRKDAWEAIERKVLTYAMERGGVVTALEIAAHTDLSYDEAQSYLDRMADKGHVEVTPTDNGLAYRFPGADSNPGALTWSPPSTNAPQRPDRTAG